MKVKEKSEKVGLKLNIQKTKIMASGPITSGQMMGKQWKQWQTLFSWAPKSLQMVIAARKLKDTCSLEKSYDQPAAAAAAAAKSLQLCPALWDPKDGSPLGSSVPGILQARTLEWVAISFSNAWKWKWSCSVVLNF